MRKRVNQIIHESAYESQDSLSLNEDSVIEEYGGLNFSDEQSKSNDQFSSEDAGHQELSEEKLKFLGIHKFPPGYAPPGGPHSHSKLIEADTKEESHFIQNTKHFKRSHSRRQKSHSNSSSQNQEISWQEDSIAKHPHRTDTHFNIDSFLNSEPILMQSKKDKSKPTMKQRKQQNRNCLEKYVKPIRRQKIRWPSRDHKNDRIYNGSSQILNSDDNPSITLVTLPEPDQRAINMAKGVRQRLNKIQEEEQKNNRMFKTRFEQAKLNFMDSFLPESMKIGNNPYKFWKYTHSKQSNLSFKIL